jgi:CBS domain-containing protein
MQGSVHSGPLPVCDGDQLVGMLTDRDITTRAVVEGCNPTTTTVHEAMTPDIAYRFDNQALEERLVLRAHSAARRARRDAGVSGGNLWSGGPGAHLPPTRMKFPLVATRKAVWGVKGGKRA